MRNVCSISKSNKQTIEKFSNFVYLMTTLYLFAQTQREKGKKEKYAMEFQSSWRASLSKVFVMIRWHRLKFVYHNFFISTYAATFSTNLAISKLYNIMCEVPSDQIVSFQVT